MGLKMPNWVIVFLLWIREAEFTETQEIHIHVERASQFLPDIWTLRISALKKPMNCEGGYANVFCLVVLFQAFT